MGERFNPAVLKTVELERVPGVRIPLPPPEVKMSTQRKLPERVRQQIVVNPDVLRTPEAMSPLGRALFEISKKIDNAGMRPRSLIEIHRHLAVQNNEV